MNELSTQVNEMIEWFTAKQAAVKFCMGVKSMRKLFLRYESYLGENLRKIKSGGRTGFTSFINMKGILILANIKDARHGIKIPYVNDSMIASLQGKKKIAEVAISKMETTNARFASILEAQQETIRGLMAQKSLPQIDIKAAVHEAVDDLANTKITEEQRGILSDLLKAATFKKLQLKVGEPYDKWIFGQNVTDMWKYLNAYIGRKTVKNYTHLDYIKAWKYLKKLV